MKSIASALVSVLAVNLWALPVFAQGFGGGDFYGHHGFGFGVMLFGGLMMIAFWGGIIVLIVLAVRWLGSGVSARHDRSAASRTALDILRERYARGEVDHDEFERRKQLLTE
ncbi:MAG: putative membrane protein [Alphaproteobacteria bacterium]|jgi:putative membrane protein